MNLFNTEITFKAEGNGKVRWTKYDRKKEKRVTVQAAENYYKIKFNIISKGKHFSILIYQTNQTFM